MPGQNAVESKALDNLFGRDTVNTPTAAPPPRAEPRQVEMVKSEGSKTPSFSKKPLNMTISSPKQATAGQRITISVTIDNQTTKKANCLQVALYSAQKKEIDMQAMYPAGFPVGAKEYEPSTWHLSPLLSFHTVISVAPLITVPTLLARHGQVASRTRSRCRSSPICTTSPSSPSKRRTRTSA